MTAEQDAPTQEIAINLDRDGDQWAPIAIAAEAEPEKALQAFERRVLGLLANKPRDLSYRLQQAIGRYDKRVGIAALTLAEANKHRPPNGWRPLNDPAAE